MTATLRPKDQQGQTFNVGVRRWGEFPAKEAFLKAWRQDHFGNWGGKLGKVTRYESGKRSRNQVMKGFVSLGVWSLS